MASCLNTVTKAPSTDRDTASRGGIGGNGEVKNLQLVDVDYDVRQNGVAGGIAMSNYGTITACSVTGDISSTGGYVGGIATSNIGSIIGCWFDGNLTSGLGNGGIAGLNYSTITACYYGQNGYPEGGQLDRYLADRCWWHERCPYRQRLSMETWHGRSARTAKETITTPKQHAS